MKQTSKQIAQDIKDKCSMLNWSYSVRGSILTIEKKITPNDKQSFCAADSEYYEILSLLPSTSAGSIWGTDGGGKMVLKQLNK